MQARSLCSHLHMYRKQLASAWCGCGWMQCIGDARARTNDSKRLLGAVSEEHRVAHHVAIKVHVGFRHDRHVGEESGDCRHGWQIEVVTCQTPLWRVSCAVLCCCCWCSAVLLRCAVAVLCCAVLLQ
jgi:hypothetical protein